MFLTAHGLGGFFNKAKHDIMTLEQSKRKLKKVQTELDKIGIDSAQIYGWGTQRLGHAQRKRDELAKEKFRLRQLIDEIENTQYYEK